MYSCNGFSGLPCLRAETPTKFIPDSGYFGVEARSPAKAGSLATPRGLGRDCLKKRRRKSPPLFTLFLSQRYSLDTENKRLSH